MSLNFPINPADNATYLDDNLKLWCFNNGYWREDINSFSIDLLRDVITIVNTDSIIFVNADGVETSIDASVDFPFIQSDNTVSNISYTPYGLPFYVADGSYDEIDISKYSPAINSVIVWDGKNWVVRLLEYFTDDIIGLDLQDAEVDDIMMWQDDKYITDSKNNHVLYEIYDNVDICSISGSLYIDAGNIDVWEYMDYTSAYLDSTGTQADLVNNRIICQSNGIYEISQICNFRLSSTNTFTYDFFIFEFEVFNSSNVIKYEYKFSGAFNGGHSPTYMSRSIVDYVDLVAGDYIKLRVYTYIPPFIWAILGISNLYSTITMKKIGTN